MLHLGGGIAFGMNVADLFKLQGTFQSRWKVVLPTEVQEVIGVAVFDRDSLTLLFGLQSRPHLAGQGMKCVNDPHPSIKAKMPHPAEVER